MSQQKVDHYKQEKAHRKERLEKEKKRKRLLRICSYFVLAVIVLAIAFAIYRHYTPKTELQKKQMRLARKALQLMGKQPRRKALLSKTIIMKKLPFPVTNGE